jgi:asparagine synthetase B (glutamine-hydrolysing)
MPFYPSKITPIGEVCIKYLNIVLHAEVMEESEWNKFIEDLRVEGKATRSELKEAIVNSIKKNIPKEKFGIMFSGGIDSTFISFICKQMNADFTCYAVGVENAADIEWAERVSHELGFKLKMKVLSLDEAEEIVKEVTLLFNEPDAVKISIACVFYAAMKMAQQDGIKKIFSGLGSEEIFAGYERHKTGDINEECWKGLLSMYKRDLLRDWKLADEFGMELLVPFLDSGVIKLGMQFPAEEKISGEHKKVILRKIAEDIGIPKEIAWRKKKAAQYGSRFDKAISKLAKKKGFKMKKDYLKSLLISSS